MISPESRSAKVLHTARLTAVALIAITGCSEKDAKVQTLGEATPSTIDGTPAYSEPTSETYHQPLDNEFTKDLVVKFPAFVESIYNNPGRVSSAERGKVVDPETGYVETTVNIVADTSYDVRYIANQNGEPISFSLVKTTQPSQDAYNRYLDDSARFGKPVPTIDQVNFGFDGSALAFTDVVKGGNVYTSDLRLNDLSTVDLSMMYGTEIEGRIVDPTQALTQGLRILEDLTGQHREA